MKLSKNLIYRIPVAVILTALMLAGILLFAAGVKVLKVMFPSVQWDTLSFYFLIGVLFFVNLAPSFSKKSDGNQE